MANTGEVAPSGVCLLIRDERLTGAAADSKRSQQNRTNKRKHGEHGQYIQLQGEVHVGAPSLLNWPKSSRQPPQAKVTNILHCGNVLADCFNGQGAIANVLIFRCKISNSMICDKP